MCDPARTGIYQNVWNQVQQEYNTGFMVSERGLQAVLHGALQANLPGVQVVVEPTWNVADRRRTPDLVLVERGAITDIFELKFVPHGNARWEDDIAHLHAYVENPPYPVQLNPHNGRWAKWAAPLSVQPDCCLHFVVIADYGARAVWPRPPLPGANGINHWFGRVGDAGGWCIR